MEVFGPTIQGEGTCAGEQTFFIRLGLCDFKCTKCDSMHSVDPKLVKAAAQYMTAEELANDFIALHAQTTGKHIKRVTISGGNPCIHDLTDLVDILTSKGFSINVETQGTFAPMWLQCVDDITVSPKSPGMGEKHSDEQFASFLNKIAITGGPNITIKIVIFAMQDIEFAAGVFSHAKHVLSEYGIKGNYYLSLGNPYPPVFELTEDGVKEEKLDPELPMKLLNNYASLAELILKDHRLADVRFLPQLHVLAWNNETGV